MAHALRVCNPEAGCLAHSGHLSPARNRGTSSRHSSPSSVATCRNSRRQVPPRGKAPVAHILVQIRAGCFVALMPQVRPHKARSECVLRVCSKRIARSVPPPECASSAPSPGMRATVCGWRECPKTVPRMCARSGCPESVLGVLFRVYGAPLVCAPSVLRVRVRGVRFFGYPLVAISRSSTRSGYDDIHGCGGTYTAERNPILPCLGSD